jgi:hypothetical protein
MICTDPYQKNLLMDKMQGSLNCDDILAANNTDPICTAEHLPQLDKLDTKKSLVNFLFSYAKENLAVLNLYIKDPYYTRLIRAESISTISFIANAGGLLGLCMGMSFVSLFELFYHIVSAIIHKLSHLNAPKQTW